MFFMQISHFLNSAMWFSNEKFPFSVCLQHISSSPSMNLSSFKNVVGQFEKYFPNFFFNIYICWRLLCSSLQTELFYNSHDHLTKIIIIMMMMMMSNAINSLQYYYSYAQFIWPHSIIVTFINFLNIDLSLLFIRSLSFAYNILANKSMVTIYDTLLQGVLNQSSILGTKEY